MLRLCLILLISISYAYPQTIDPLDPFALLEEDSEPIKDEDKSAEQLIFEAENLEYQGQLLDSRSKLLLALKKDPSSILAHVMLADYYYRHVGHFRLVLKYLLKANELFEKSYGKPPYAGEAASRLHSEILRRLAESRLNLDDYEGALKTVDNYLSFGYRAIDVAGSKAWILMKLNRIDEAIEVSKNALSDPADFGRVTNVLGILLSMKGQREEAIEIFENAYKNELSFGSLGSPATPLNNVGEVYRELFREEKAKRAWLKAVSLPDGCEHVLPSLNLATLNMEAAEYSAANETMNNFDSCIAQFPLRNGEEYRALVALIRSRITLQTGDVDQALKLIDESLRKTQWFGKIGSSEDDLKAAVYASYSYALDLKNNHLSMHANKTILEKFSILKIIAINSLRSWWYQRKALKILSKANSFEDLYPRHTDSLLDYPTLGSLTQQIPYRILKQRVNEEEQKDTRENAKLYYHAYLAENLLQHNRTKGLDQIKDLIKKCRDADKQLKIHLSALLIKNDPESEIAISLINWLFDNYPASIANYALAMPVNSVNIPGEFQNTLNQHGFYISNQKDLPLVLSYKKNKTHQLTISRRNGGIIAEASADNLEDCINRLNGIIFKQEL